MLMYIYKIWSNGRANNIQEREREKKISMYKLYPDVALSLYVFNNFLNLYLEQEQKGEDY